jgi:hypothetical protein
MIPYACVRSRPRDDWRDPRPIMTRSARSCLASSVTVVATSPTATRSGSSTRAACLRDSILARASSRTCSYRSPSSANPSQSLMGGTMWSSFTFAPVLWPKATAHCICAVVLAVPSTAHRIVLGTSGDRCSSAWVADHTGHLASCSTLAVTEPIKRLRNSPQPCVGIMIRSTALECANSTIFIAGSPEFATY